MLAECAKWKHCEVLSFTLLNSFALVVNNKYWFLQQDCPWRAELLLPFVGILLFLDLAWLHAMFVAVVAAWNLLQCLTMLFLMSVVALLIWSPNR
jgi:hypothetical protein